MIKLRIKKGYKMEKSEINIKIGKRINKRRKELTFTQKALAEKIYKTTQCIGQYERGEITIKAITLYKISKILLINMKYFFEDKPFITKKLKPINSSMLNDSLKKVENIGIKLIESLNRM